MTLKKIRDYLPKRPDEMTLIQVRLGSDLVLQVREILKREKISWTDLLKACLERFLDESKER